MSKHCSLGECILDAVIRLESRYVRTLRAAQNWNLCAAALLSALDLLAADLSETMIVLYEAM
jgi:hypothetical protein